MARVSWIKFVEKHKRNGLAIHVSWVERDPRGKLLSSGKIAPAALALLQEVLAHRLVSEWAVKTEVQKLKRKQGAKRPKGVKAPPLRPPIKVATVLLEGDTDAKTIEELLGLTKLTFAPSTNWPCRGHANAPYDGRRYTAWLKELRYLD